MDPSIEFRFAKLKHGKLLKGKKLIKASRLKMGKRNIKGQTPNAATVPYWQNTDGKIRYRGTIKDLEAEDFWIRIYMKKNMGFRKMIG